MTLSVWARRGLRWEWVSFIADDLGGEATAIADQFAPAIVIQGKYVFKNTYLISTKSYNIVYRSHKKIGENHEQLNA